MNFPLERFASISTLCVFLYDRRIRTCICIHGRKEFAGAANFITLSEQNVLIIMNSKKDLLKILILFAENNSAKLANYR